SSGRFPPRRGFRRRRVLSQAGRTQLISRFACYRYTSFVVGFVSGSAGLVSGIDVCLTETFVDGAFVDAEVLGDLGDRSLLVAIQSHTDDVIAELFRAGLSHGVYPSRLAYEQARSDVTKPCHQSP